MKPAPNDLNDLAPSVKPGETDGVVRLNAPEAWLDWWQVGRFKGEKEPPGRPDAQP
jgi:hypothetical protein